MLRSGSVCMYVIIPHPARVHPCSRHLSLQLNRQALQHSASAAHCAKQCSSMTNAYVRLLGYCKTCIGPTWQMSHIEVSVSSVRLTRSCALAILLALCTLHINASRAQSPIGPRPLAAATLIHRHRTKSPQEHNDPRMLAVPVVTVSTHDGRLLKTVDAAFGVLTDVAHCLDHSAALVTQIVAGQQGSTSCGRLGSQQRPSHRLGAPRHLHIRIREKSVVTVSAKNGM
jgi:hypothetical protein